MKHSPYNNITKKLCFFIFIPLCMYYAKNHALIDHKSHTNNTDDTTFEAVKTTVFDEKTRIHNAITAINSANISTDVLDFYVNQDGTPLLNDDNNPTCKLKKEFLTLFIENIHDQTTAARQSDNYIRETLTLLYITKITGAIIYMIATHNIEKLKKNPHEKIILTKEHIITSLESIKLITTIDENQKVIGYHFYGIPIKTTDLDIDEMIKTPIRMYHNIYELIKTLLETKAEFKQRNYVPFSNMLNATIKEKSIRDHLQEAAHNIENLNESYFSNIKQMLLELGESIQKAKTEPQDQSTNNQYKAKIANILHTLFTEEPQKEEKYKQNAEKTMKAYLLNVLTKNTQKTTKRPRTQEAIKQSLITLYENKYQVLNKVERFINQLCLQKVNNDPKADLKYAYDLHKMNNQHNPPLIDANKLNLSYYSILERCFFYYTVEKIVNPNITPELIQEQAFKNSCTYLKIQDTDANMIWNLIYIKIKNQNYTLWDEELWIQFHNPPQPQPQPQPQKNIKTTNEKDQATTNTNITPQTYKKDIKKPPTATEETQQKEKICKALYKKYIQTMTNKREAFKQAATQAKITPQRADAIWNRIWINKKFPEKTSWD